METNFEAGRQAALNGKNISSNPFICGVTKLGNPKFSDIEAGCEWDNGFKSTIKRFASEKEMVDAAKLDISRFRRKSNKYYGRS